MSGIGVGVQLYSVRNDLAPEPLPRTLERLAAAGATHVEPFDVVSDPHGVAAAIAGAGLDVATAHAKIGELGLERVLDAAEAIGIGTIVVPMAPPPTFAATATVDALAAELSDAAVRAAERGIRIGYHNHDFEFVATETGERAYDRFVARLDPSVVIELDAYWASVGGADAFDLVRSLGDRVRFLHVKDDDLVVDGEARPEPRPIAGTDLRGRIAEIIAAPAALELPVVEVVVHEGDVWPLLSRTIAAARSALAAEASA